MEVYESHMGGIYFDEDVLSYHHLYCEQCGDADSHLGHAETWEEVLPMLRYSWEDEDEYCYKYDSDYIEELKDEFESLMRC